MEAQNIINDFKGRRDAILKALTNDLEDFVENFTPEKGNVCLYGTPDGQWRIVQPNEICNNIPILTPSLNANVQVDDYNIPIPTPGLNANVQVDDYHKAERSWFKTIAFHSNSWILAVASYHSELFEMRTESRLTIFKAITALPTIYEEVRRRNRDAMTVKVNCTNCLEILPNYEFWVTCYECGGSFHPD